MKIEYLESEKLFRLASGDMEYVIGVVDGIYVGHVYYGKKMGDGRCGYFLRTGEAPFVPSVNWREKCSFADAFPWEYSTWGMGDYRDSCLNVRDPEGFRGCELHYEGYRILEGKPEISGMPATFCRDGEGGGGMTLELTCRDKVLGLKAILRYSIFADSEAVMRSVELVNEGHGVLYLERALTACLDMDMEEGDLLTLGGSWSRERHMVRRPLAMGKQLVSSFRGESGHQDHPFLAVMGKGAGQDQGEVYAMHFVYSGNFVAEAEVNQFGSLRLLMGINPEGFEWVLNPGESFATPEVVCVYSDEGLGKMTHILHDLYRGHLIRSPYLHRRRPVLINNWEATYFDFNTEKLLEIAREASKRGIEMLVMDDGWFQGRHTDSGSLGDWNVDENKLKGGLPYLVGEVQKLGMGFGIWFEPEMVSPDSDLYRAHPDWAIQIPGREPVQSRAQYVLDLSRPEVVDYVYEAVASVLRSAPVSYVKWDMNRQMTDVGSTYLGKGRQGELFHRYVLGLYSLQERLTREFPELLLENCASGGARFDPGMLYYSPQVWCSDNTDAIERLAIQEGTALLYPLSAMGAHVSACPNHVVGRITPFATRGHVAMAGAFGYELDITKLPEGEKRLIERQVETYHELYPLMLEGDYYRIASWAENHKYDCWQVVAKDKSEALVTYVQVLAEPNCHSRKIRLKGLDPEAEYQQEDNGQRYKGALLMYGGVLMPRMEGDFASAMIRFIQIG
ncbi:MAG: alpha-galactosidase [Lachnospiraceae bacterium]|nr:alpha-galactosidase [Lachnospiraceae bacterium]